MFLNQNRFCTSFDGCDFFGALSLATDAFAPHQRKSHQCKTARELTKTSRRAVVNLPETPPDANALAEPVAFERDILWEGLREVSDQAGGEDARIEQ